MKIRKKVFNQKFRNCLSSLVLLFVVSCAHQLPPVGNIEQFSQQVVAINREVQSLKSKTTLVISTPEKSYNLKAGILVNDQGSMFIETYGFGVPQAYISVVDQKLKIILVSQKEMFTGSSKSSLEKIISIPLAPDSLIDPLLHQIKPVGSTHLDVQKKEYVLTDSKQNHFYIDGSHRIFKIEMNDGKQIEYGKPLDPTMNYPQSMKIKWKGNSIQIFFDDVKINQEISKSLFQIDVPTQGFHVYSIDPQS